ncbi:MAG: DUF4173 domain-containing protein [Lachnospiraceae bacterium]|nr:DUF4173 domain-containing protein [Lachnospiraceae bacterium]
MDNHMINTDQQALVAMPQVKVITKQDDIKEMKRKEKRFQTFGIGSFFYALFYTFCLYHNASGITYPFFAGGTLLFFGYFIRKSESSSADGKKEQTKAHINKIFLMTSIIIAGGLNCTTDSGVLIFFNKLLMLVLLGILLLQCWHDLTGWSITAYIKGSMAMLFGGICHLFTPAGDMAACWHVRHISNEEDEKNERNANRNRLLKSVGIGLVIVMPMVMFIAILLASADEVFRMLLRDILTFSIDIEVFENSIKIILMIIVVFAVCYGLFAYNTIAENRKAIDNMAITEKVNWDSYIAVTVNGVMCVMYLVFSVIQIFGLFLGKLPEGYTYASYARHGFFELVFVCLFNIILVLCTLAYFESSRLLRTLLTMICGCTYIMTISSAYRMLLYISSYQLTFLRLLVLWGLVMIAIVMTGVLVCIYNQQFSFIRFLLMVLTTGWLCFSAVHPDYWIASYNILASDDSQEYDSYYLTKRLSLDAVAALPEEIYQDTDSSYYKRVKQYQSQKEEFMGARKFNFSRAYAGYKISIEGERCELF